VGLIDSSANAIGRADPRNVMLVRYLVRETSKDFGPFSRTFGIQLAANVRLFTNLF
jgi:hypothetical protein